MEGRFVIVEFYEAMNYRGWVKSFLMEDLDPGLESKIKHYVKYLKGLHPDEMDCVEIIHHKQIKKKHMGIFSEKAPYYFVVYMKDLEDGLMNAGYLMGQLALYLTTKELGSYVTGIEKATKYLDGQVYDSFEVLSQEENSSLVKKEELEETWMCIMAFGKPERKIRQMSKTIDKFVLDKKCVYKTQVSTNIQMILNAAVYAPTKMLVRPYRFVIHDQRVHLYAKNEALMTSYQRVTFYLDCGIMLAYLGVKAEELWMTMSVTQLNRLLEREQKHYHYISSLIFEDQ